MIATLRGKLGSRGDDHVVVEVGGIGFRVRVLPSVLDGLGAPGSEVELHTHLHVRENELALYGFASEDELALFQLLLTVSGVGPRVALGILSAASVDTLRLAIAQGNAEALSQMPGIGKKTAQRLVLDLKGKIDVTGLPPVPKLTPADAEVIAALTSLGYSVVEAQRALRSLPPEEMSVEDRVLAALRYLGSG